MNAPVAPVAILKAEVELLKPGMAFAGGYFVAAYNHGGELSVLVVSPKKQGDIRGAWNDSYKRLEAAASYFDGLANTRAMAEAGSSLAKQALALDINGFTDWFIPAQDELELCYRNLKPFEYSNSQYGRSGLNASAMVPTYPYTSDLPAQTDATTFREGGNEAFEDAWYWTSTQHSDDSDYAWMQYFGYGTQGFTRKSGEYRCRAVRRLIIQ